MFGIDPRKLLVWADAIPGTAAEPYPEDDVAVLRPSSDRRRGEWIWDSAPSLGCSVVPTGRVGLNGPRRHMAGFGQAMAEVSRMSVTEETISRSN